MIASVDYMSNFDNFSLLSRFGASRLFIHFSGVNH